MPPVDSSAILEIDYDPASRTLFIRFVDGDLYAYFDVPAGVYDRFLAADSKGRFFAEEIRGSYRFHQITRRPAPTD